MVMIFWVGLEFLCYTVHVLCIVLYICDHERIMEAEKVRKEILERESRMRRIEEENIRVERLWAINREKEKRRTEEVGEGRDRKKAKEREEEIEQIME